MPIPAPFANETENAYSIRAHSALMGEIPDTDERNAAVFSAWRQHRGPGDLEQRAAQKYGRDCVDVRDVPVWAEHEIVGRDGKQVKYGRDELAAIVDKCNSRIADTGDFAALTFGHTPTQEQKAAGMPMPELAGFAGPFRLGMIGKTNPRWAIFADEHHHRDTADLARKAPRRSPEVWLHPRIDQRFMDPIALLGAETPRLDLGMRYGKIGDLQVEKYAATEAGCNNVFVPGDDSGRKRDRYEEPEIKGNELMLAPEDIQQIVAAISETDWAKWSQQKMEAERGTNPTDGAPADDGIPAPAPAMPPEPAPAPVPGVPEKKEPYSKARGDLVEAYSRISAEHKAQSAELKTLRERLDKTEAEKRSVERYSALEGLARNFAFDLEKEAVRCAPMTDEQFKVHQECIVENYSRIETGPMLEIPALPLPAGAKTPAQAERYSKDTTDKAVSLVMSAREQGKLLSFDQAIVQVRSQK